MIPNYWKRYRFCGNFSTKGGLCKACMELKHSSCVFLQPWKYQWGHRDPLCFLQCFSDPDGIFHYYCRIVGRGWHYLKLWGKYKETLPKISYGLQLKFDSFLQISPILQLSFIHIIMWPNYSFMILNWQIWLFKFLSAAPTMKYTLLCGNMAPCESIGYIIIDVNISTPILWLQTQTWVHTLQADIKITGSFVHIWLAVEVKRQLSVDAQHRQKAHPFLYRLAMNKNSWIDNNQSCWKSLLWTQPTSNIEHRIRWQVWCKPGSSR